MEVTCGNCGAGKTVGQSCSLCGYHGTRRVIENIEKRENKIVERPDDGDDDFGMVDVLGLGLGLFSLLGGGSSSSSSNDDGFSGSGGMSSGGGAVGDW